MASDSLKVASHLRHLARPAALTLSVCTDVSEVAAFRDVAAWKLNPRRVLNSIFKAAPKPIGAVLAHYCDEAERTLASQYGNATLHRDVP